MTERIKKIAETWRSDYQYSTLLSSTISTLVSLAFTVYNGILGIVHQSLWNGSICVYYMLLAIIRAVLVKSQRETGVCGQSEGKKRIRKVYIGTHILLLLMDISLIVPIVLMVEGRRSYSFGLIPAIAMAAYTTYRITMSVIHFRKSEKSGNPIVAEVRMINLTDSLLALLTLQNALINANGGMNSSMTVLTTWTSSGIFILITIITIWSFIKMERKS